MTKLRVVEEHWSYIVDDDLAGLQVTRRKRAWLAPLDRDAERGHGVMAEMVLDESVLCPGERGGCRSTKTGREVRIEACLTAGRRC